jgi:nucleoid DNA-binding protein
MKKTDIITRMIELDDVASVASATRIYDAIVNTVLEGIATDGVVHLGNKLGTFKVVDRQARTCVNPQKPGEKIQLPARKVVRFKVSSSLKAN